MMTVIEEKASRLISALIDKTQENKVVWEKTLSEMQYRAQFSGYAIIVRKADFSLPPNQISVMDSIVYMLSIRNGDGQVVEIVRESSGGRNYDRLAQIFRLASESAGQHLEEGLDRLLQELESR